MRQGYYDDKGEFVETNSINNLVMFPGYNHALYCVNGHYMKLLPTNHDLPAFSWCCNCKSIPIRSTKVVFDRCVANFKELYKLKTLSYDIQNRSWEIVSNEWIGESRVNSHRKVIGPTERDEILTNLKNAVQDELGVEFENWTEYFSK